MPATKFLTMARAVFTIAGILLLPLVWGALSAHAAAIQWKTTPYNHYANQEAVQTILKDFFATQGIGVVCSEKVNGVVSGRFANQNPEAFFNHMAEAYNLVWYYDGAAVYLYSAHEMVSRFINLGYLDLKRFKQNLIDLDILDPKFTMRIIDKDRIIYVVGPDRYVQLISEMAEQLDAKAQAQRGRDDIIRIFPLKHAWAEDKIINFRDKQITIPGVAAMLRNLITETTAPGQVVGSGERFITPGLKKLKGHGLIGQRQPGAADDAVKQDAPGPNPEGRDNDGGTFQKNPPSYTETDVGFIQADPRQNAVVVRDREEKMPYYEEVIGLLDAPVALVEIRAAIMDVDRSNLKDLGVQWEFKATGDDGDRVARGGLHNTDLYSEEHGLQLPLGDGLNITTIIGDATNFFLTKIHALEQKGHAKILSRPSVLTLNNVEAQLEHSQTVYVRVAGNEEVDLFDINTGVILRVTPHIIEEDQQQLVKLAIQIEDGELSDQQVDAIPIVKKSVVNTQAVVGQTESLLIGGYIKERNISDRQSVPCLGSIPLLGWLFTKQANSDEQYERLFLITPTIIPYPNSRQTTKTKASAIEQPKS